MKQTGLDKFFSHVSQPASSTSSLNASQHSSSTGSLNASQPAPSTSSLNASQPTSTESTFDLSFPSDIASSHFDSLYRPTLATYQKKSFGLQQRSFSSNLYKNFDFIEYSILTDAVYCFPCRMFGKSTTKYTDWKNITSLLQRHATTNFHLQNVVTWRMIQAQPKTGNIIEQLDQSHRRMVAENREYVKTLARVVVKCGIMNIPLRGHAESCDSNFKGNFHEIIDLLKVESPIFKCKLDSLPSTTNYLSPDSQNALLHCSAKLIMQQICHQISESGMFALIMDGCTDIVADNLSICVRYINVEKAIIYERFLMFEELDYLSLDAQSIVNKMLSLLNNEHRGCAIDIKGCIAFAADGASVMSGEKGGVQQKLRQATGNYCMYVHCYAHRLNLALSATACHVKEAALFFSLLDKVDNFINGSIRRKGVFKAVQDDDTNITESLALPAVCHHKWNFRERIVDVMHKRFNSVIQALRIIQNSTGGFITTANEQADAKGLADGLQKLKNVVCLVVFSDIFSQLGPLSNILQSENTNLGSALTLAREHLEVLRAKRTEQCFTKIWSIIKPLADIENGVPMKRRRQQQHFHGDYVIDSTIGHEAPVDANDVMSQCMVEIYYPIIDRLILEMESRFPSSPVLDAVVACQPQSTNFLIYESLKPLLDAYKISGDINSEIFVLNNIMKKASPPPETMLDVLNLMNPRCGFPALVRLYQVVLSIPIANTSAERSFSTLNLVRTHLRSTMTEMRLSNLSLLSIEKDLAKSLDMDNVVDEFAKLSTLRVRPTADNTNECTNMSSRRLTLL